MDVIIFGTGGLASEIETVCTRLGFAIKAFSDNNPSSWNRLRSDKEIIPPSHIPKVDFDKIIIASSFHSQIEPQLQKLGVRLNDIFIYPGFGHPRGLHTVYGTDKVHTKWQTLVLQATNRCNLHCRHCARGIHINRMTWKGGIDIFTRYLSCFAPDMFIEVCVSGDGELTILPNFPEYLQAARQIGWDNLSIITNGTCTDARAWEQVFADHLLKSITISIEAGSKEIFEDIRGYEFTRFLQFLQIIKDLQNKYPPRLEIIFNGVFGRMNFQEIPKVIDLAAAYEIKQIRFNHLLPFFSEGQDGQAIENKISTPRNILDQSDYNKVRKIAEQAYRIAERNNIPILTLEPFCDNLAPSQEKSTNDSSAPITFCGEPYRVIRVRPDGSVYPCIAMPYEYPLGNLNDTDFSTLWNGKNFKKFLSTPSKKLASCKTCHMLTNKGPCLDVKLQDYVNDGVNVKIVSENRLRSPQEWLWGQEKDKI